MALWVCVECSTAYAVGAPRCPHCRSTVSVEQGEAMPKITRHGGPTIAGAAVVAGAWSDSNAPDEWPAFDEPETEEEVASSPGSSSSPSPEKPPTSSTPSEPAPQRRARMTASRSKKAQTGASSARSTDGDLTADTSASEDTSS